MYDQQNAIWENELTNKTDYLAATSMVNENWITSW